jgi:hypothetical protein
VPPLHWDLIELNISPYLGTGDMVILKRVSIYALFPFGFMHIHYEETITHNG